MNTIHIFVGGHARQNNGEAGIGLCYHTNPEYPPFFEEFEHIGVETQNSAVYKAVKRALERASSWQFNSVVVYTDNRLVAGQLADNMSARAHSIVSLYDKVKSLAAGFTGFTTRFVPTNNNRRAKELARVAALASPDTVTAQALQFEVGPGITGLILAFTPKMMFVQIKYKKGSKIAMHQHYHEQGSYIVKGYLKYNVADQDIPMRRGAALVVQGNSPHSIEAMEDTVEIVTYSPMRADLLKLS